MESLHNYDSGDDHERRTKLARKRDASYDAADSDDSRSRHSRPEKASSRRHSNGRRHSEDRSDTNYEHLGMELSEESRDSSSGSHQPEPKRESESKKSGANPFAVDKSKADKSRHRDDSRDSPDRHRSKRDHRSESSSRDRDRSSKSSKSRDEERPSNRDRKRSHRDEDEHRRDRRDDDEHWRDRREEDEHRRDNRSDRYKESSKSSSSRRDREQRKDYEKSRSGGSSSHKSDRRDRDYKRHDSRHRSQSKERKDRRERSRSHEREPHDRASSHSHSNYRPSTSYSKAPLLPNHLISRQERDAQKAEQLKKMGIEYGVAGTGCNGNSVNLAAAYAVQQAILLSNQNQQKKIPALMSLGVTNPNAPPESAVPIMATNAAPSVGSIQSLTNFTAPSILASARYTEQMQKRKQLWSHKKTAATTVADTVASTVAAPAPMTTNKWEETRFSQDNDGKVASKFLRLMGMKDVPPKSADASGSADKPSGSGESDPLTKQNEMFNTMEHQYEVARQVTHTMRGMGLGFGSQPRPF